MKKLFCVVLNDLTGTLDSPHIFHVRADDGYSAERAIMEQIIVGQWIGYDNVDDVVEDFDIFSIEVEENDIVEA